LLVAAHVKSYQHRCGVPFPNNRGGAFNWQYLKLKVVSKMFLWQSSHLL
jgi:hypothetical protein